MGSGADRQVSGRIEREITRREEVAGMLTEYIEAALAGTKYELIQDEEPYYGEVPGLQIATRSVWLP